MKERNNERGRERARDDNQFQKKKNHLPFCSTLALIAISRPTASGLQTGGHSRTNRRVQFYIKGKNKKQNSSLSNQVHNSPLTFIGPNLSIIFGR